MTPLIDSFIRATKSGKAGMIDKVAHRVVDVGHEDSNRWQLGRVLVAAVERVCGRERERHGGSG